ncbi:MAG: hypothetical protein V1660_01535 [archaeon]
MINHKKSQIGTTLTLIAATIIIFFLLFFFLSITNTLASFKFSFSLPEKQIPSSQIKSLQAYLNTESLIGGDQTKISEMIRLWTIEGNPQYFAQIKQETDIIFSRYSNEKEKCYFLKIQSGENSIESGNAIKDMIKQGEEHVAYLPLAGSEQIKISFRLDEKCIYNWE